jgi:hypothetical protein
MISGGKNLVDSLLLHLDLFLAKYSMNVTSKVLHAVRAIFWASSIYTKYNITVLCGDNMPA